MPSGNGRNRKRTSAAMRKREREKVWQRTENHMHIWLAFGGESMYNEKNKYMGLFKMRTAIRIRGNALYIV